MTYSIDQLREMKKSAFEDLTYCCFLESEARQNREDAYHRYMDLREELRRRMDAEGITDE